MELAFGIPNVPCVFVVVPKDPKPPMPLLAVVVVAPKPPNNDWVVAGAAPPPLPKRPPNPVPPLSPVVLPNKPVPVPVPPNNDGVVIVDTWGTPNSEFVVVVVAPNMLVACVAKEGVPNKPPDTVCAPNRFVGAEGAPNRPPPVPLVWIENMPPGLLVPKRLGALDAGAPKVVPKKGVACV